jgi:actin-related protein
MDIPLDDAQIAIIVPTYTPRYHVTNQVDLAFENTDTASASILFQESMMLFSTGRITGHVCKMGHTKSSTWSIIDGCASINYGYPAHSNISTYCGSLSDDTLTSSLHISKDIAKNIREKLGYVALDFENEKCKADAGLCDATYELPDGKVITLSVDRFAFAEEMFTNASEEYYEYFYNRDEELSIQQQIAYTIECQTDMDYRRIMRNNIILCGGLSLLPQFAERLNKELNELSKDLNKSYSNVISKSWREDAAWIGASMLANMSNFGSHCVSKQDYDEQGLARLLFPDLCHFEQTDFDDLELKPTKFVKSFYDAEII